jgi:hypothetical protein
MSDEHLKSNIALSKITKLKNTSGWKKWKLAADEWLLDQDYDLPPPEPVSPLPEGASPSSAYDEEIINYEGEMKKWERKQLKGVNNLKSICEERGKTLLKDIKLINDAIEKLEDEFKPKGDADFTEVYNDWQLICLASYKDVDDYVEKFNDLYGQLQELDFTLPKIELVMKFIHGLGQPFSSWHQSLSVQYDITATNGLSLTEVQGKARVEEKRMNREDTQTALLAKQARQNQHSHQQKRKRDEEDNSRPFCRNCSSSASWGGISC